MLIRAIPRAATAWWEWFSSKCSAHTPNNFWILITFPLKCTWTSDSVMTYIMEIWTKPCSVCASFNSIQAILANLPRNSFQRLHHDVCSLLCTSSNSSISIFESQSDYHRNQNSTHTCRFRYKSPKPRQANLAIVSSITFGSLSSMPCMFNTRNYLQI